MRFGSIIVARGILNETELGEFKNKLQASSLSHQQIGNPQHIPQTESGIIHATFCFKGESRALIESSFKEGLLHPWDTKFKITEFK